MGTTRLYVNESANDPKGALVDSFLSKAPARQLVLTQGDTARAIEIHFLEENTDPSSNQPFVYGTAPTSTKLSIGPLNDTNTSGTFTITDTAGSQTTAAISTAATAAEMQAAIRAACTTNFSAATVSGSQSAGFTIDRVTTGALADISISVAGVSPENSVAELFNTENGTSDLSEKWFFRIVRPAIISQTSFSNVSYAAPASTSVTTGTTAINAVHRLTWPSAAYAGSVSLSQSLPTGSVKTITSNTVANPTVVTSTAHGLSTGDQISIVDNNGTTPTIAGVHTVTVTGTDTFTIPINASVGGTGGSFYKLLAGTVGPVPYNVGTTALEDLLEEHASTLAVDGSFAVEKVAQGNYLITFKGGLAAIPIPVATVTSSLSTPVAVSGTLNCKTAGVLGVLGTSQEATSKLEIEKTVGGVPTTVAYREDALIRAEIIPTA